MKMVAPTGFAPILNGSEPFVLLLDEGALNKMTRLGIEPRAD